MYNITWLSIQLEEIEIEIDQPTLAYEREDHFRTKQVQATFTTIFGQFFNQFLCMLKGC
jgi:hypothetical protein